MAITMAPKQERLAPKHWLMDQARGIVVSRPAGIMGILNATPDSFSDGGQHHQSATAIDAGVAMVTAGASWLDVGGESSRPGATPVSQTLEIQRVIPVITGLRAAGVTVPISIDTVKAGVAAAAMAAGASAINDISAGGDPDLFAVAARYACPLILMHMRGTPQNMQNDPSYADVVTTVIAYLRERLLAAERAGVDSQSILVDPGIGFGKTVEHNLALLRALPQIESELDRPVVLGISRKSFIATVTESSKQTGIKSPAAERDAASHVLHGMLAGSCALLRVHDVAGAVAAVRLHHALLGGAHVF